jgi:succinylglutamic semialdehyde dehydrogenase
MFTGSGAAGAHFRRKFADDPHVILALELGGNNPLVVWGAADAEAVAGIVVQSAFITTGQRCSCARRLILPEGAAGDAIVEAVAKGDDKAVFALAESLDSDQRVYLWSLWQDDSKLRSKVKRIVDTMRQVAAQADPVKVAA